MVSVVEARVSTGDERPTRRTPASAPPSNGSPRLPDAPDLGSIREALHQRDVAERSEVSSATSE